MKRATKWILIVFAGLVTAAIAAILIIPALVDINDYKPEIQNKLSEITGRPVSLQGDLGLSVFPWAGVTVSDLIIGNPSGFEKEKFVTVKSFEARIKLLPLLSGNYEIKRFVLKEPHIILIKNAAGKTNWEISDKTAAEPKGQKTERKENGGFRIADLTVEEFSVNDGSLVYIDQKTDERTEVKDIDLVLDNVSLNKPVSMEFGARISGILVSLKGNFGPLGNEFGKNDIPLDLELNVSKQFQANISGKIIQPVQSPGVDLKIGIDPFSFRKLSKELGYETLIETRDSKALDEVAMTASVTGNSQTLSISDAIISLDDSKVKFSASAEDFSKPVVKFNIHVDPIDLDRYMPPVHRSRPSNQRKEESSVSEKPIDYTQIRKMVVDGNITAERIKLHNAVIGNVKFNLSGRNGEFTIDPLSMNLYQGKMKVNGSFDVKQNKPRSRLKIEGENIQAGPFLNDVAQKDILEGKTNIDASLNSQGDKIDDILKNLDGNAELLFENGAIKGVNLHAVVQNIKAAYLKFKGNESSALNLDSDGRTDFSKLHAPFTIQDGVAVTDNTTLAAPTLRLKANGSANLVKQTLDFRLEPRLVATIKGQGDKQKHTGLTVPILLKGSFSDPVFRPDLDSIIDEGLNLLPEIQKKLQKNDTSKESGKKSKEEEKPMDQIKDLLKVFPGSN